MVARLIRDKGVLEYIESARLVKGKEVKAKFLLVGSVDSENPSELKIDEIKHLADVAGVELTGHCNEVDEALKKANIVVLPSYREGFSKVLIEAAACGRAIVTTDVPGCRDAIIPNRTGLLVPARDSVLLADAIISLISDSAKRNAFGLRGRTLAEEKYGIQSIVARHLEEYRSLNDKNTALKSKPNEKKKI